MFPKMFQAANRMLPQLPGKEEQRHHLPTHVIGVSAGTAPSRFPDSQTAAIDSRQQERAMPEHDDHQRGQPRDIDRPIARGGVLAATVRESREQLGQRHPASIDLPEPGLRRAGGLKERSPVRETSFFF